MPATQRSRRLLQAALGLAAGLCGLLLAACGGGGAGETPGAAASSYTSGTITGFGSVIVNGVRFDDSSASISDDSGSASTASALKLGMRVEIDGGLVQAGSARAHSVRFGSAVLGPVQAVDAAAGTLTVLGQAVTITDTTVFDEALSGGLAAVSVGHVLDVHGLRDSSSGGIVATRIAPVDVAVGYKLRAPITALDTTAKTLAIGGASVSYAGLSGVPASLSVGQVVLVWLAEVPVAGVWQATRLAAGPRKPVDSTTVLVRGAIGSFVSATSFTLDGLSVDASAASFPDGTAGLAAGVQVEVRGSMSNGVLVASQVSIESRHRGDDSRRFELHGAITSLDATAKTFVLRGVTVDYSGSVTWVDGSESTLAVGAKVAVRGTVGSTRSRIVASRIQFNP